MNPSFTFPHPSSETYRGLLTALVVQHEPDSPLVKSAEQVIARAFCDELLKLAFGKALATMAGGALLSQGVDEVMNRTLYGNQAGRSAGDILKDTGKSMLFHAPFAAVAHYGLPKLEAIKSKPGANLLTRGLSNVGELGLHAGKIISDPVMHPGMQAAGHLMNYALA